MPHRFDRDTALELLEPGLYAGRMDPAWWVKRGPNGGYVAATLLRALQLSSGDTERMPRSLTVHFLAPPAEGPVQIRTTVERQGRRLTTVSGRLLQDGRVCAVGICAFGTPYNAVEFQDVQAPELPKPEDCPPQIQTLPIDERVETRVAFGLPFEGGDRALCGGWLRPEAPRRLDAPLLVLLTDAWFPAAFTRARGRIYAGAPTIDLTVHFRVPLPLADAQDDDYYLARFESTAAGQGYVEESGQIFTKHGVLLAHSRQHALLIER